MCWDKNLNPLFPIKAKTLELWKRKLSFMNKRKVPNLFYCDWITGPGLPFGRFSKLLAVENWFGRNRKSWPKFGRMLKATKIQKKRQIWHSQYSTFCWRNLKIANNETRNEVKDSRKLKLKANESFRNKQRQFRLHYYSKELAKM